MALGPDIDIEIVRKRFPGADRALFEDLRLTVSAGSVLALVGPSGVGKSTLLRMLAGIDNDYTGTIALGGRSPLTAPLPGFVFQDARLLPWLSARDNLLAVDETLTRDAADGWLSRVGLAGAEGAYPHALSGGMQRRVALARALAVNSSLLLLDEPFVSLDRQLVRDIETLLAGLLRDEKSTTIMVTHMPEDAANLADRAIVLARQPAAIIADIAFEVPRDRRDERERLRLTAMLGELMETGEGPVGDDIPEAVE